MRSSFRYVAVAAVVLILSASAYAGPKISVHMDGVKMFGSTLYVVPEIRGTDYYERELEFPLNPLMGRLNVGVEGTFSGGTPWRFLFDIRKNINDPGSPMTDTGWVGGSGEEGRTQKYLLIESDAELGAWMADVSARLVFYRHPRFNLEGILGYGYRTLSYEMFGQCGWVGDPSIEYSYFEGEKVIEYDITYHVPYAGIGSRIDLSPAWGISAELTYSPRAMAKHDEDIIVRNRTTEADCSGKMIASKLGITWTPRQAGDGLGWFVGAGADIFYATTDGDQAQSWYGDDWETGDDYDDTGRYEPSIDTEIKSTCGSIYVRAGLIL